MSSQDERQAIESRLRKLRDEIAELPTQEKLRLAAQMLDHDLVDMALSVVVGAEAEIRLKRGAS